MVEALQRVALRLPRARKGCATARKRLLERFWGPLYRCAPDANARLCTSWSVCRGVPVWQRASFGRVSTWVNGGFGRSRRRCRDWFACPWVASASSSRQRGTYAAVVSGVVHEAVTQLLPPRVHGHGPIRCLDRSRGIDHIHARDQASVVCQQQRRCIELGRGVFWCFAQLNWRGGRRRNLVVQVVYKGMVHPGRVSGTH